MDNALFFDRKTHKETAKAQIFYAFVSLYESLVFAFLTLFLNSCRTSLGWSDVMVSFSLFIPCIGAAVGALIASFFVSTQKINLRIMRLLCLFSFCLIITLGLCGLFLPSGMNDNGFIVNRTSYYLLYSLILALSFLLMGSHYAFLSFHTSNNADINLAEHTKHGHICLYGSLVPIIAAPVAGLIAESIFHSYKGYLFLFLVSSPVLLIIFSITFLYKPFGPEVFHNEGHEKSRYKDLFSNKKYLLYLFLCILWIPLIWASDSLISSFWANFEESSPLFNPFTWGCFVAFASIVEFTFVFINTKWGFGKKVRLSVTLSFIALFVECIPFGLITYLVSDYSSENIILLVGIVGLHALKGVANGAYLTSNLGILNHIVGPKLRRKAVFFAPFLYQIMNSFLQLAYPYIAEQGYSWAFISMGCLAFIGLVSSLFLDISLFHERGTMRGYEE